MKLEEGEISINNPYLDHALRLLGEALGRWRDGMFVMRRAPSARFGAAPGVLELVITGRHSFARDVKTKDSMLE